MEQILEKCKHPKIFFCPKCAPFLPVDSTRTNALRTMLKLCTEFDIRLPYNLFDLIILSANEISKLNTQLRKNGDKYFHCDCKHEYKFHAFDENNNLVCIICNPEKEIPYQLIRVEYANAYYGMKLIGRCEKVIMDLSRL